MASRIVCDIHEDRLAETLIVNVGDGVHEIDLCTPCEAELLVVEIYNLLNEYGVPVAESKKKKPGISYYDPSKFKECPQCRIQIRGGRANMLNHLAGVHKLGRVAASLAFPPEGKSVTCQDCGMLLQDSPQAVAAHRASHVNGAA